MADKLSCEGLKAAADATKQIITLSTGVIALTVTFLERIMQPQSGAAGHSVPWTMLAAWVLFGLAILAATVTLGAVAGTLDAIDRKQNGLPMDSNQNAAIENLARGSNVQVPARLMSLFFALAMGFTVTTGFLLLR